MLKCIFPIIWQHDLQVEVRPTGSRATAAWVRLVAAVQPRRHGGYTLQLHSGVCLRNATDMPLQIGWQSPQQDTVVIEVRNDIAT